MPLTRAAANRKSIHGSGQETDYGAAARRGNTKQQVAGGSVEELWCVLRVIMGLCDGGNESKRSKAIGMCIGVSCILIS